MIKSNNPHLAGGEKNARPNIKIYVQIWYGIVNSPHFSRVAAGLKGPKIQMATACTCQPRFKRMRHKVRLTLNLFYG